MAGSGINYPNDFNILKNHNSLIINLRKKHHRRKKSFNHKMHRKNLFLTFKACPGLKYKFTLFCYLGFASCFFSSFLFCFCPFSTLGFFFFLFFFLGSSFCSSSWFSSFFFYVFLCSVFSSSSSSFFCSSCFLGISALSLFSSFLFLCLFLLWGFFWVSVLPCAYSGSIVSLPVVGSWGRGGVDFSGFVHSSYPHWLPDLVRDFASGSSLFLSALRSPPPPSSFAPSSAPAIPPGVLAAPPSPSYSSAASASAPPLFSSASASAPAAPPLAAHLSAHPLPLGSFGAGPVSSHSLPGFPSLASAPPPGLPLPPHPQAPSFPPSTASSSSAFWPPSSSASSVLPSASFQDLAVVPGLGVGVPLSSSGVPPFPSYLSAPGAPPAAAGWPPAASAYDPHAFPSAPPPTDLLSDSDERFPDDDHPPFDPSAPAFP